MRNLILAIVIIASIINPVYSQWSGVYFQDDANRFDAGFGMTWIDNQAYHTFTLQPDLHFGKLGVGLDVQLLLHSGTSKFRSQDWNTASDWVRMIRYLRWGQKGDRFYIRIGALDLERLGHGFILNYYNNQQYYDERKLGLMLDLDFGHFGFESMANNLGRLEVIGGRGYYRPFYQNKNPVLRNLAFGASYVTDLDPDSRCNTENSIGIWGIDVEMPVLKTDILQMMLYADHAQILDYGNGQTIGLRTDINLLAGFLRMGVTLERRFLGSEFVPAYFGPFYEVLRYSTLGELQEYYESQGGNPEGIPDELSSELQSTQVEQQQLLPMFAKNRKGWYAGLGLDFLHLVRLFGFYQTIDNAAGSGLLHLGAELSPAISFLIMEASYDKRGLDQLGDIWTLDYRSIARIGLGYKIYSDVYFYLDYIWGYTWDSNLGQYKPQERFQPRLALRFTF